MAEEHSTMSRKEWRKLYKKQRRKRIRRKLAQERDLQEAKVEARKLTDPKYIAYLEEKEQLEQEVQQRLEERCRYENALWMDREAEAQQAFEAKRKRLIEENREENEKREKIRKEFEEREQKSREAKAEKERLLEEFRMRQQERERMLAEFLVGIDDHIPVLTEMVHTRTGRDLCKFFSKIGACRYGVRCSSDHPTPGLSELLLIPNFFAHPALDEQRHPEYGHDSRLEFDEDDLHRCYNEFFTDIIEEFESFGSIKGIFVCRNFEPHLRGNVFIQYNEIRSAAHAYQRMNGRFYASKQLRVEFRSPVSWTSAVCGNLCKPCLFEQHRCQKGKTCNYLHLMTNPVSRYKYDHFKELISIRDSKRMSQRSQLVERTWDDIEISSKHKTNWRWSETPEVELPVRNGSSSSRTSFSREQSLSTRDRKHRSRSRGFSNSSRNSGSRRSRSRSRSRDRSRSRRSKEHRRKPSRSRTPKKKKRRDRSRSKESRRDSDRKKDREKRKS